MEYLVWALARRRKSCTGPCGPCTQTGCPGLQPGGATKHGKSSLLTLDIFPSLWDSALESWSEQLVSALLAFSTFSFSVVCLRARCTSSAVTNLSSVHSVCSTPLIVMAWPHCGGD